MSEETAYAYFLNGYNPDTDALVLMALEDLRDKSGLAAETLELAQVKLFSGNADLLKERLGFASFDGQKVLSTARLVEFPSSDVYGKVTSYHYRLYPAVDGRRYLHPKGEPARPYVLAETWAIREKPNRPLWIAEGSKKALSLIQHGRHAISLTGVWAFRGDGDETFLFDDLEAFSWRGRTVYLGFDMDLWSNPQVRFALYELALKLMARGALIRFPKWIGAKGIDDLLAGQKDPEKSLGEIEDKALPFDSFITPDHKDELVRALKCARAGFDALSWESLIGRIAKRLTVRAKTLFAVLAEDGGTVTDTGIVIANPSYEINQTFMSLGFKETVLVDNEPRERNLFTIATHAGFVLHDSATFALGDEKIVFNVRERVLMSLSDKWDKGKLTAFIKEPASPEGVFCEIEDALRRYIEFQNDAHYGLLAAWLIATYFHRCFNAFPFLFFYGKKQSGKSRALDLLERLSFNAIKIKGVSVPSLADSIDAIRASFLMDQAEILSDKKNVELLGILADSYTIGGGKRRVISITNKSRRVLEFETYSPKAFASISEIDTDLKDRCIELNMVRAEKEYPYPEAFLPIWPNLRDKLYRLLLTQWQAVREIYQAAGQGVKARVRELWRPIDAILILEKVPEDERVAIREAFLESMEETQTGLTDLEVALFEAIKALLGESEQGTFTTSDIVDKMGLPDTADFSRSKQTKWVGRTLNKLTLFTKREGRVKNRHSYLFTLEHVENIFNRYQTNGMNGTSAESANDNGFQTADLKSTSAENGRGTAEDMPTHADPVDSCRPSNSNGSQGSLDNQQDCRYADRADHLITDKKTSDDDFNSLIEHGPPPEDDLPEAEVL
jgi:hypothetical protein